MKVLNDKLQHELKNTSEELLMVRKEKTDLLLDLDRIKSQYDKNNYTPNRDNYMSVNRDNTYSSGKKRSSS